MPGTLDGGSVTGKRKRTGKNLASSPKRARSESSEEDSKAAIFLLENEIFESKKNFNNISKLVDILRTNDEEDSIVAAISLCRVFVRFMTSGDLSKKQGMAEKEAVVVQWLKERYAEYKTYLLPLFLVKDSASTALTLSMKLLKCEGSHLQHGQEYSFPTTLLTEIVSMILENNAEGSLRDEFSGKYVEEYDDIRFYTFEAINKILSDSGETSKTIYFDDIMTVLTGVESVPETVEELEDFYLPPPKKKTHALYSLNAHKKRAQGAWLAVMSLDMDKEQRKGILGLMENTIAPWFIKPELLMDFLTDSYDTGGSTSLQALSGIFYLIRERNLDYPEFYKKLYSLLDSSLLHSKHRSRFFRLLETFLGSTHLPAVLVASFIKRLSRLTLFAPPAAVVAVVPYVYNLLKVHPSCTFMIHREVRGTTQNEILENEGMIDPFRAEEEDPMETHAIESSLWEIVTLQSHYHPNVATLAKIISEQFTKHSYSLEDFLDHSYGSMLEAELSKEVKKPPVVEFVIPKKIITKQDLGSDVQDTLLAKLWDFDV